MEIIEFEPFEPGYFDYDYETIGGIQTVISYGCTLDDLFLSSEAIRLLDDFEKNHEKIFLEKYGKDPRYLNNLKMNESRRDFSVFKFDSTLIDFFKSLYDWIDDEYCFEIFIKDGYSNLLTLYDLFKINIENPIYTKKTYCIKLTEIQRNIISPALESIIYNCKEKIKNEDNKDYFEKNILRLENNIIGDSDFVSIIEYYMCKKSDGTLLKDDSYSKEVRSMWNRINYEK
jgi:hypothetical protein